MNINGDGRKLIERSFGSIIKIIEKPTGSKLGRLAANVTGEEAEKKSFAMTGRRSRWRREISIGTIVSYAIVTNDHWQSIIGDP